ncbi:MAG: class I tRNA ligase family protein, partial [Planctomycetota bacterium]
AGQLDKVEAGLKSKLADAKDNEREPIEAQLEALGDRRATMLPKLEQLRDMAARGVKLALPLCDREIPLIADIWAKPELGSGCVKITPAHDANDYEVWQRNSEIGATNIMNADGTLADTVPEAFRGLTMKKARTAVLEALTEAGAHDPETDVDDRTIDLAHSDRSKTPIEPYLADQWFVKMDELAQSAMDAVTAGKVKITPERYTKTYLDWLSEKRDWPVGRQLWWGHRIPVWSKSFERPYNKEKNGTDWDSSNRSGKQQEPLYKDEVKGRLFIQHQDSSATGISTHHVCVRAPGDELESHFAGGEYGQSEEVLDTWFSSALWPFSTIGWPEQTPELAKFYPTSTLITSRDIITLWVARMVLMGEKFMGEVPFKEVYIHPKILDGYGETMSKSKGNGVDPLDVIDRFGADSLRFGIAYLTTETQDVRMPVEFVCPQCDATIKQTKKNRILPVVPCAKCGGSFSTQWAETEEDKAHPRGAVTSERFELGRNFCNKLWNASRFALQNLEDLPAEPQASATGSLKIEDRWLLSRLETVTSEVTEALESYRYADAARALYDFAWNEFCSFYVEITKARFAEPGDDKTVAQRVLAYGLDVLLRLLHPMAPFLTEEVWQLLGEVAADRSLGFNDAAGSGEPAAESVCVAPWPVASGEWRNAEIEAQFAVFQQVLGAVREVRQSQGIAWTESLEFAVQCDAESAALLEPMRPYFAQMAKATPTAAGPNVAPAGVVASKTLGPIEVHVDVERFIDVDAERARLTKERDKLAKFVGGLEGKLSNEKFVANAPAEVVEQQRAKLAEAQSQLASIEAALAKLG